MAGRWGICRSLRYTESVHELSHLRSSEGLEGAFEGREGEEV